MKITKIVLTGGPCAGKSTAMSWIQNEFRQKGYTVLFVPETATELILGGITPWGCATVEDFQASIMKLQIEKEKIYEEAAQRMNAEKILIVCDRGLLDSKAYMEKESFFGVVKGIGSNIVDFRDNYDAVFHLVTAAKGAKDFYTLENNGARTETPEEAAAIDDRIISAWTGHPHLRVIDNTTSFQEKMKRLIKEIALFLGEPEPREIERKFLIEYPDINWLENNPNCQKVEIIQTYLNSPKGEEIRLRQRGIDGHYIYIQTKKKTISSTTRIEVEKRLTQDEYLNLLMDADITKSQIRKTRYCLIYDNQYFEIDIFPFWKNKAIAEIELNHEDESYRFPSEIKVIREVTYEEIYKNSELAVSIIPAND